MIIIMMIINRRHVQSTTVGVPYHAEKDAAVVAGARGDRTKRTRVRRHRVSCYARQSPTANRSR